MPLYRSMKSQHQFSQMFGVLNVTFIVLIIFYILIGLLGYIKYGSRVSSDILISLPNEPLYNSVLVMYSVVLYVSHPIKMYVVLQQLWPRVERCGVVHRLSPKISMVIQYTFRTCLVILTCIIIL